MLQILVHCWILYSRCHWHTQNNGHPPRVAPPVWQHCQGDVPGTHSCACLWPWGNPHSLCKWGQDASHWTTGGDNSALPPEVWHVSWPWVHVNIYMESTPQHGTELTGLAWIHHCEIRQAFLVISFTGKDGLVQGLEVESMKVWTKAALSVSFLSINP